MNARQLRLVRAAAISSAATLIAAISHTWGGGSAPHPLLVIAVATLLTPLSALLVGVHRSRIRVAVAVCLGQTVFHVLFQVLGAPTGATSITGGGHVHHIDLALLGTASALPAPSTMMLFAHAVAAVLTTLLVWHGESVVRAVAVWVEALFRQVVALAPAAHRRPPRLRSTTVFSFDAAVAAAVPRRGPPALVRD
ncbi:hypothetical protein [Microbacterium sp. MYb62]|uniref:hypothetical protein n=1 Tax=Microbacterium sp. MYb62 TaxID=1848690 RepID=UPI000CFAB73D|nr:hypothetical protein [Microbacterium sp. MYb62]PRB19299.1 hypothetical protein CQ042_01700 [Microbacterium sp. MYb62]